MKKTPKLQQNENPNEPFNRQTIILNLMTAVDNAKHDPKINNLNGISLDPFDPHKQIRRTP
jgi:hypothetical protein